MYVEIGLIFKTGSSEWIRVLVTDKNGNPIEECRVDQSKIEGDTSLYIESTTTWIIYEDHQVNLWGTEPSVARVTINFGITTSIVKVKATVFANGESVKLTMEVIESEQIFLSNEWLH